MKLGKDVQWEVSVPQTFCRNIYQAIDTADRLEDPLGKLKGRYKFRQRGNRVVAEYIAEMEIKSATRSHSTRKFLELMSLSEVIGAVLAHSNVEEVIFENPIFTEDSWGILDKWCKSFNYEYTKNPLSIRKLINAPTTSEEI